MSRGARPAGSWPPPRHRTPAALTAQDVLDEEPVPYGAFYGIPYVPIPTSARDRHRTRVKS